MKRGGPLARKTPLKAKTPLRASRKPVARRSRPKGAKTSAQLRKELDALFSRYIRYSAVEPDGLVSCYTCPYRGEPKKMP